MSFVDALASGFRRFMDFDGRASRPEFWYWMLAVGHVLVPLGLLDETMNPGKQMGLISWINVSVVLAIALPSFAVAVRRLHDTDRSGHWLLLWLTIIGAPVLFVLLVLPGSPDANRYGCA